MALADPIIGRDSTGVISAGPLSALLSRYRERQWYFVSPGGNWGDQLIYAGAENLAARLGISRIDLDAKEFLASTPDDAAFIYLHGGGGLNPWSSGRAFATLRHAVSVPRATVIQGPQTCGVDQSGTANLLKDALSTDRTAELHLFARDRPSHAFLARHAPKSASVYLDHDTALQLQLGALLKLAGLSNVPRGRYPLQVVRQDDEASSMTPHSSMATVRLDPSYVAQSFRHWLRIHAFATIVTTDRLHSAIVSMLLGKPVTLLAGSYHKNKSVWEYSLAPRGVRWLDSGDLVPRATQMSSWIPSRVANSWKLGQLLRWLRGVPLS